MVNYQEYRDRIKAAHFDLTPELQAYLTACEEYDNAGGLDIQPFNRWKRFVNQRAAAWNALSNNERDLLRKLAQEV